MQQKLTWLRISLFTKKCNWHYLLVAIESFISQNSFSVVDFSVEFNFLCGENIRLAILVSEDSVNELPSAIANYFKRLFLERNLSTEVISLPVAGIFKPFEQNTIQFGLFEISHQKSATEAQLGTNLSKIIVSALRDDEIDDETIITLAFYLHAAILSACQHPPALIHEIKNYYRNSSSRTASDISIEYMEDKFKNHRQELIEIFQNIMVEKQSELPDWMPDWICCIKDQIETYSTAKTEILQIQRYYKVISIVNGQLGISDNSWLLVSYFLEQTSNTFHSQNLTHLN
jgi:hypothetical protein